MDVVEENGLLGAVAGVGGAIGRAVGDMFAAEKHLNDTLANSPGPGAKFEVNKDTVLKAASVVQRQIDILDEKLFDALRDLRINLDGLDEVNRDIAAAWNDRLVEHDDSYARRVDEYLVSLNNLVEQLRGAAKQYGFTEEEIQTAVGGAGATR
ncbi:hypothetical protein [Saccharothrix variisporea]|uniref:Uncharacterized protein n=1 Tax=Saccharothrix variisporea TaxID=543527 RepID=A0A495XF56_9PSEU|nr:hypothetical protein [Saccharothrix variisporea]RKT71755.1 hypothetical protein DFJ66_5050 [Saccharothrix variisporea]